MAHFAEIDDNNIVLRVLVVPDEQENRGQQYLADDMGLGGIWIQTSYNATIRANFAGIGATYDPDNDVFIYAKPYDNWVLDNNHRWIPPEPQPDGDQWAWDQENSQWVEMLPFYD